MSNTFDFGWNIGLAVAAELPQGELAACVNDLNVALVNAVAEVVMTFRHSGSEVHLAAGDNQKTRKVVKFRNDFEIVHMAVPPSTEAFHSAAAAVDQLILRRATDSLPGAERLALARHPDGSYRLAERQWSSCEFDTEIEAQDALQAFEDASGYDVLPFLDITCVTYDGDA
jgi:hypothetical protein